MRKLTVPVALALFAIAALSIGATTAAAHQASSVSGSLGASAGGSVVTSVGSGLTASTSVGANANANANASASTSASTGAAGSSDSSAGASSTSNANGSVTAGTHRLVTYVLRGIVVAHTPAGLTGGGKVAFRISRSNLHAKAFAGSTLTFDLAPNARVVLFRGMPIAIGDEAVVKVRAHLGASLATLRGGTAFLLIDHGSATV